MRSAIVLVVGLLFLALSFLDNGVLSRIHNQLDKEIAPREKLFLHLDNNLVEQGKHVWFKAYLTKKNELSRSELSQVLYIDLLTLQGEKVLEYKYLIDSGKVGGGVFIPDTLENDNYILSAYTNELRNYEQGYTQILEVKRYASLFKNCKLTFDKKAYDSGDDISFEIQTLDVNDKPIGKINYDYRLYNQGVVIENGNDKTDKEGTNSHELSFDPNQFLINPLIIVSTTFDDKRSDFYFEVPRADNKVEVINFFPEGGQLVQGRETRIGFHALDQIGGDVAFHGYIIDQMGNQIVSVASDYNGIGSFVFQPKAEGKYQLKVANSSEVFLLPEIKKTGYGLSFLGISKKDNMASFELFQSGGLDSLVHAALITNGRVHYFSTLVLKQKDVVGISLDSLETGIAEFRLYSKTGEELASRRIYINADRVVSFDFSLPENVENAGEFVEVEIEAKDYLGAPVQGDFSIAVTEDMSLFHGGFNRPNIISSLLVDAEVSSLNKNGNKLKLSNYYSADNINDLLLILDFESLTGTSKVKNNKSEDAQDYLYGLVLNKNNVPQAGVDIVAIVKGTWDRNIITSNEFGFFKLPISLLNAENKGFILGIADEGEHKNLKIRIEKNTYRPKSIRRLSIADITPEFLKNSNQNNFDNARMLPAVTVEDESFQDLFLSKKVSHYGNFTSMTKEGSELKVGQDFLAYIRQVTNVAYVNRPSDGNIVFRGVPKSAGQTFGGGGYPALFILDGVPVGYNYHDLDYLRVDEIKSIDIIKSSSAVVTYGTRATGGVIIVKTGISSGQNVGQYLTQKKLEENLINDFDRAISVDFFEPKNKFLDFNSIDDTSLKTTLYWSENLIFDENGIARVRYRNSDLPAKIAITINGISNRNVLGYGAQTYFVDP